MTSTLDHIHREWSEFTADLYKYVSMNLIGISPCRLWDTDIANTSNGQDSGRFVTSPLLRRLQVSRRFAICIHYSNNVPKRRFACFRFSFVTKQMCLSTNFAGLCIFWNNNSIPAFGMWHVNKNCKTNPNLFRPLAFTRLSRHSKMPLRLLFMAQIPLCSLRITAFVYAAINVRGSSKL